MTRLSAASPLELERRAPASLRDAFLLLNTLSRRLTRTIDDVAGPGLSSNADIGALLQLRPGPLRPRDLVAGTGLSSAGVSGLGDRLEAHSLITRERSVSDDGRGVSIALTTTGRDLADRIIASVCDEFDAQVPLRLEIVRALGYVPPPESSLTPGSEHVIGLLAKVGADVFEATRGNTFPDDPSPNATAVVLAAAGDDFTRPRDLIEITNLSSGGVTLLVDRLVDAGLVRRAYGGSTDRRAVSVVATSTGRATLERCLGRLAPLAGDLAAAVC